MLALLRFLLRGMRLVAHLREAHREDVQALEARLAAETRVRARHPPASAAAALTGSLQRASALSRAAREAQDALRREGESRRRTEQMLRAYKDEVRARCRVGWGGSVCGCGVCGCVGVWVCGWGCGGVGGCMHECLCWGVGVCH